VQQWDFSSLLFAQAFQGGVGLNKGRVHRLGVARDQPGSYTLGKDVLEQVFKDGLARTADGRVLRQVIVHLVTKKI
jgi:hypothetical protein